MFLTVHLKKSCSTGELLIYFLISFNSAETSVQWPNWKLSKFLLDCLIFPQSIYICIIACLICSLKFVVLFFHSFAQRSKTGISLSSWNWSNCLKVCIPQYFRLVQSHEDVSGYFILSRILFSINENNF